MTSSKRDILIVGLRNAYAVEGQALSTMRNAHDRLENYPQLKADQLFLRLQDELSGTENRIAVARQDYNEAARDYNSYIR